MSGSDESKQREELESQVWSAIAAFEQIVQTIPNDRVSLEALSHAYEQVGDLARSLDYLIRLVGVVVDEKDRDTADLLRERLVRYSSSDERARKAEERLEAFLAAGPSEGQVTGPSSLPEESSAASRKAAELELPASHVATELSFAWTLFQAGELTQEEYASVAQDLSEISAAKTTLTVSVLHVLQDRGNRHLDRILEFVARDTGTPMIPLSLFDVQPATFRLLPRDFVVRNGVMAYELMGHEAMVVILNPYNKTLRKQAETIVGRHCHFFLTLPSEFDTVVDRLSKAEDDAAAAEQKAAAQPAKPATP